MITRKICPRCGSDDVQMIAGGTIGMWMCKKCGFSGSIFPEKPIVGSESEDNFMEKRTGEMAEEEIEKKGSEMIGKKRGEEMTNNIRIWKEDFAIIKSKNHNINSFANIHDGKEITLVIEKSKINKKEIIEVNNDWKLITFNMILPLELVGFISKISKALADEGISIFVISGYSTDHVLVKKHDLNKAIKCLEKLEFEVIK